MSDHLQVLRGCVATSKAMLTCAQEARWDDLADLEKRRQRDLAAFFATATQLQDSHAIRYMVADIVKLDRDIGEICVAERDESAAWLRKLRGGRNAASAYQSQLPAERGH